MQLLRPAAVVGAILGLAAAAPLAQGAGAPAADEAGATVPVPAAAAGAPTQAGQPTKVAAAFSDAFDDADPSALAASIARLRAQVATEPGNLGAQLDLAIAYCLAGEPDEAQRLLLLLDSRPDLPPSIADVISWYRGGGCKPKPKPYQAFVAAGAGYSWNLNLAPLSGRIFLPGIGTALELAESSRRRDAPLANLEAGGVWSFSRDRRWTVGAYAQAVRYRGSADYALNSIQGALAWRDHGVDGVTEAQASVARLSVGERTRLFAWSGWASRLWPMADGWLGGFAGSYTQIDYFDQSALNSRLGELRARVRWQGEAARVTADLGWLADREVANRPGGDRTGPVMQAQALWLLSGTRSLDATLRQGWLSDSVPYSPAFFGDEKRAPRITTLNATLRQSLAADLNARLELRYVRSRDTISLFDYSGQAVWMSLEWLLGGGIR